MHPELFKDLIPQGRNPGDVSRKGWPDAYAVLPDGRIAALEATHSPSWRRHLEEEDLRNAEGFGCGRLAGFLFVAWAPAPKEKEIYPYRERLVGLGVPPENIHLVFKGQLVRDLTQPRFASTWIDFLQLPSHSRPFDLIQNAEIFGRSGQLDVFAPTIEEFLNGHVSRPVLADEIERDLEQKGWALIRGLGAAGKTALAAQIAFNHTPAPRTA